MIYGGNHFIKILNIFFLFLLISGIITLDEKLKENISVFEENKTIQKYISKGKNDTYQIIINEENITKNVFIELMIFSGDTILLFEDSNLNIESSQNANKFLFNVTKDKLTETWPDLKLNVNALKNSYYSIRYRLNKKNQKESKRYLIIPNNTNFLVTIPPHGQYSLGNQKIRIINEFNSFAFLINFNFVNCQGKIVKIKEDDADDSVVIPSRDDYYCQDIITKDEYSSNVYDYIAQNRIIEQGTYDSQMCMIYISCTEIGNDYLSPTQHILVGENVPQRIIFNKIITNIKYLYQIPDIKNDLAVKFLLAKRAEYNVTFYIKSFSSSNYINKVNILSDRQELIKSSDYIKYCKEGSECGLIVEIELLSKDNIPENLELEVAIKSLTKLEVYPSYIIKNKVISDYLNYESPNYFYTEIGKSLSGEIIINYYRGSGMIYGAIVKKYETKDKKPDWMGKYKFPSKIKDTLPYISYLKKLEFTEADTDKCNNGCYLLLKIIHYNHNKDTSRYSGYDISVFTDTNQHFQQIFDLPLEKYVYGSISENPNLNNYIINIPYDAEKVAFEMQGENLIVYLSLYNKEIINLGPYYYPSEGYHHWSFSTIGKKGLFEISRENIIQIGKNNGFTITSLEGIYLTIGIFQKFKDSFSSIYAFKYNLEYNPEFRIYEVYSDQQTLCNTTYIERKNKCLYIIKYNKIDTNSDLVVYPILDDESKDIKIYADFIDQIIYDMNDIHNLSNLIPTEESKFSKDLLKEEFLYINLEEGKEKYLYISIETDLNTTISLLTSNLAFDYSKNPNPGTWQLYAINNKLELDFSKKEDLIINIEGIKGSANISWVGDDSYYIISGRDDRIALTTYSSNNRINSTFNNLIIKDENLLKYDNSQISYSLYVYLSFNFRSMMPNFDEIQLGSSYNLVYRNTNFPLTIYIRNFDTRKDTNAFITIYNLENQNKSMIKERQFNILGTILSDNHIDNIRNNHYSEAIRYQPKYGVYDPSKRVGLVCFDITEYEQYNPTYEKDKSSNLVIQIFEDNEDEKYKNSSYSISIEAAVFQNNSIYPITENVYQYGKLKIGEKSHIFKLSNNNFKKITCIIFSSNSNMLDKKIILGKGDLQIIEEYNINGRNIIFINTTSNENSYILLNIFTKNNKTVENEDITNYAFKYINIDELSEFHLYEVINPNITYSKENSMITIEVVNCDKHLVTYFVHFILRSSLVNGETFDNIAVIQSPGIIKEFKNKDFEIIDNNKTILNVSEIPTDKDYECIQVIAYINIGTINEYIAYNTFYFEKKSDGNDLKKEKERDRKLLIVSCTLGSTIIILIIILLIIILKCNKKNKDLINKVNATSFQNDNLGCFNQEDENNPNFLME